MCSVSLATVTVPSRLEFISLTSQSKHELLEWLRQLHSVRTQVTFVWWFSHLREAPPVSWFVITRQARLMSPPCFCKPEGESKGVLCPVTSHGPECSKSRGCTYTQGRPEAVHKAERSFTEQAERRNPGRELADSERPFCAFSLY